MAEPARLEDAEIRVRLDKLPGWSLEGGRLHRSFRFADFNAAFGFMTRVALIAETMSHHPDWRNVYSRVDVYLITHDAGGLTDLDFELAGCMDEVAGDETTAVG